MNEDAKGVAAAACMPNHNMPYVEDSGLAIRPVGVIV